MKKIFAVMMGAMLLMMTGCGEEATVDLVLPAEVVGDTASFDAEGVMATNDGIKDVIINDDGSVTYKMTQEAYDQMMNEISDGVKDTVDGLVDGEMTPHVKAIDYDQDFKVFEVKVDSTDYMPEMDMATVILGMTAGLSQQLMGMDMDVTIRTLDEATGEVISEVNYPEALDQ